MTAPTLVNLDAFARAKDRSPLRCDFRVPFADGVYRFNLGMAQTRAVETAAGCGIFKVYGDLSRGRLLTEDGHPDWANVAFADAELAEASQPMIIEVIRQGLIGGNEAVVDEEPVKVSPARAQQLIEAYVAGQPLADAWMLAFAIVGARICGRAPDPETEL